MTPAGMGEWDFMQTGGFQVLFSYVFVACTASENVGGAQSCLTFVTPWTAAHQASLSFTISQSLLKLMSIQSVMPSNHHPLSSPSPPAFSLSQHQGLFQ